MLARRDGRRVVHVRQGKADVPVALPDGAFTLQEWEQVKDYCSERGLRISQLVTLLLHEVMEGRINFEWRVTQRGDVNEP